MWLELLKYLIFLSMMGMDFQFIVCVFATWTVILSGPMLVLRGIFLQTLLNYILKINTYKMLNF